MSRAYCLTCNEHVHETPSGTCPLGHPVAADGYGPEPWVGFAGDTETELAEVRMHHLDTDGRPREHAGVGQHVNGTAHVNGSLNGSANGSSNGHAGSLASSNVAFPSVDDSDRPVTSDLASDDLTALLAEALRENAPEEPDAAPVDEPHAPADGLHASVDEPHASVDEAHARADDPVHPPVAPAPHQDEDDWSELASLAAELHLDEEVATDDGPAPTAPPEPEPLLPSPSPVADTPEAELSSASIDDLLAELTGGTADPAPASAEAPVEPPPVTPPPPPVSPPPVSPPPPAPADPVDDATAWDAPPPPAVPVDETTAWDAPPPPDDVGSAPTAEPVDIWAEAAPVEAPAVEEPPVEEPTAAPVVDLYNFTARGKRVGDAGSAAPARKKKRGRKR